ncbi:DUF2999 family protein [Motilimonas pumila]|uniref:DUF2999 family protein n=1 Tax=Motilimonas pumila TaxID=2303987 RepID=A0A418YFD3_9GAMM|nr:DUF2999 family protein [Motilimonas pumila]RJG47778.1 DUF2999 family protein [Motilimonas pumila]
MNPIISTLKEHNVSDEQIASIFQELTENPLQAMTTISQLGIPQEKLQPLIMSVMANPGLIQQAVEELGLDFSKVEAAKQKLDQAKGN